MRERGRGGDRLARAFGDDRLRHRSSRFPGSGTIILWDNRVTMHRGRPFDSIERRDIRQTRLGGDSVTIEQAA
jgi:alpha-ketoglutarate-dependent taurine dioxygenase